MSHQPWASGGRGSRERQTNTSALSSKAPFGKRSGPRDSPEQAAASGTAAPSPSSHPCRGLGSVLAPFPQRPCAPISVIPGLGWE